MLSESFIFELLLLLLLLLSIFLSEYWLLPLLMLLAAVAEFCLFIELLLFAEFCFLFLLVLLLSVLLLPVAGVVFFGSTLFEPVFMLAELLPRLFLLVLLFACPGLFEELVKFFDRSPAPLLA